MFVAYKKFWTGYFNFRGKSTQGDFWRVFLIHFLCSLILLAIMLITAPESSYLGYATFDVLGIILALPSLTLSIRRLRDTGLSIWLWLLFPASFILWVFNIYIWAMILSILMTLSFYILMALPSKSRE